MEIRWFGTATISFSYQGYSILFDPFLPMNKELPSPSIDQLAALGDIFITHGHFDHLMHVSRVLKAGDALVYCCEVAADSLLKEGIDEDRIGVIQPGKKLVKGPFEIKVYKGAHIKFDLPLIIKTLLSRRALSNIQNLKTLLQLAKRYPEGEVFVYEITAGGKTVLHLGSLNLDKIETYPKKADLLTLPFQGRSNIDNYAIQFIERLEPKALYLHHFDDSFPPISSRVYTSNFIQLVNARYPNIKVVVPRYEEVIII